MPRTGNYPPRSTSPLAAELRALRAKKRRSADEAERKAATQIEIAKSLDVAQATVSSWECGTDLPRLDRLPQVAAVYGARESRLRSLWLASATSAAAARAA